MNKDLAKTIGTMIRQARMELNLTQEDTAERVDVSVEFYARIERGNSLPSMLTFARIASALGVSADSLLGHHPLARTTGMDWTESSSSERPEVRRVMRRLRHAPPSTQRLASLVLKEFEEAEQATARQSASDSGAGSDGETRAAPERADSAESGGTLDASGHGDPLDALERLSAARGDFEAGAHARPLRARERSSHGAEWDQSSSGEGDVYLQPA